MFLLFFFKILLLITKYQDFQRGNFFLQGYRLHLNIGLFVIIDLRRGHRKNTITVIAYPNPHAGNDQEALTLTFGEGPTLINAFCQDATNQAD